ncbi:enoyl-CoA hydratase/isomerase family protein [Mycolicibacter heraklionensis]|uniref:Enoyl-CoA hydratase/isomerase family protein n=1 Tax=Mycolicibacter heraklionensis TaxID=512402 RepID=A0A9X7ZEY7_9MYCO|nr:enoyl-CoA hydratase/isomerase family protein [Mycolicibacter heraklionensis]QZA08376.1 enoyl-CoA hydratase/isomerase family protein [Mycolicibacter heraklionensis]
MSKYETIRYEERAHVGTLTLARPGKRNALNPAMRAELDHLGRQLLADEALRCLIVAGDGPAFSAGIDLVEDMAGTLVALAERPVDDETVELGLRVAATFEWIPQLGCPSVAAVRGHAYGAGLQLALACDIRIFTRDARVGLTETRYGLLPDMGATFRLPRLVGEGRARELILLGEVIDAAEALRIGLANRVVGDDELDSAASEFAQRLARQPQIAVRGARRAIDAGRRLDDVASLRAAVTEQARCLASDDFRQAIPTQTR